MVCTANHSKKLQFPRYAHSDVLMLELLSTLVRSKPLQEITVPIVTISDRNPVQLTNF